MQCVLLGTSTFALPTAEVLMRSSACDSLGTITKPDEPIGRGRIKTPPPLAVWAKMRGARFWQPETKGALTALLRELKPDVVIVVAYGKIIPPEALAIPRLGFVNLHPSLLPKYRGPSPIQSVIANGDTETGVTLILLDAKVDHGPIIAQERVPLSPTATRSALERELAMRGAALLERTLPEYLLGRITPQPQDDTQATTTPLLTREHGRIDWNEPAAMIERKVRAYEGWPGTWTTVSVSPPLSEGERRVVRVQKRRGSARGWGMRLKVLSASVGDSTNAVPGAIARSHSRLDVACGDGSLLTLLTVQPEGKPAMDGGAFLLGHQDLFALE